VRIVDATGQVLKAVKLRRRAPRWVRFLHACARRPGDIPAVVAFLWKPKQWLSLGERLVAQLYVISYSVDCPHSQEEILRVIEAILLIPRDVPGCIVEAGCYKGCTGKQHNRIRHPLDCRRGTLSIRGGAL